MKHTLKNGVEHTYPTYGGTVACKFIMQQICDLEPMFKKSYILERALQHYLDYLNLMNKEKD